MHSSSAAPRPAFPRSTRVILIIVITLYSYFRSSAAYRVRIALNLKSLPYEYLPVHLVKGEQRDERYRALNPQALVPMLIDDRETITQSMAIVEYLDETVPEPPLLPATPEARDRVRHPSAEQPAGAEVFDRHARRERGREKRLVPALDRAWARGARGAACGGQPDRRILSRRETDACRCLPHSAARQRAPVRFFHRRVSNARTNRIALSFAGRLRARGTRPSARRGLMAIRREN